MEKQILDAHVLIRFLRDDHPQHSRNARALVARAEAGELRLVLFSAVFAEVVFVLTSVYECTRREVSRALLPFLRHGGVECPEAEVLADSLERFNSTNVDYIDCYLAAAARSRKLPVASFDRDFRKFDDIDWRPPED